MTLLVGSMAPLFWAGAEVGSGGGKRVDCEVPWVVSEERDEGADWIEKVELVWAWDCARGDEVEAECILG